MPKKKHGNRYLVFYFIFVKHLIGKYGPTYPIYVNLSDLIFNFLIVSIFVTVYLRHYFTQIIENYMISLSTKCLVTSLNNSLVISLEQKDKYKFAWPIYYSTKLYLKIYVLFWVVLVYITSVSYSLWCCCLYLSPVPAPTLLLLLIAEN